MVVGRFVSSSEAENPDSAEEPADSWELKAFRRFLPFSS